MFSFMVLEVGDENRVDFFPYAKIINIFTFDKSEQAIDKANKYIDKFIEEYVEEDYTEEDLKEIIHTMNVDNVNIFKNIIIQTDEVTMQFIVTRI